MQVRIYYNQGHIDYACQLFVDVPILRLDNKEGTQIEIIISKKKKKEKKKKEKKKKEKNLQKLICNDHVWTEEDIQNVRTDRIKMIWRYFSVKLRLTFGHT